MVRRCSALETWRGCDGPTQRLFHEFLIDGFSHVEIDRLNYLRSHQENLRLATAARRSRIAAQKLTQRCQDAMACDIKHGKLSLFVTVTCNPEHVRVSKAGLPHAQTLNTFAPDDPPLSKEAIDKMFSAEILGPSRYPEFHETVTKHMLHGQCGRNPTQPCT
ncbi:BZ3500_MvSof-1268-A1-R1_Chr3-1g05806 [Microbotryum saponariae]|uniref:BZ3500_MvSof-1268-A1-R1_Chr3-1g05806 protein n=1 Tax=Microbotryum saponariae TaxID=289078 RepID=A0A2X0NHC9_9BASI|nr:BZ3500_MvSof-1268-A1-R1_Chr3-1g05806 [Microbotryum saponariae]SDA04996.1 BZ3501_MvSof-1269-A2-R1_Chr3-1g05476 [Microbotryum saponariae]